MCLRFMFLLTTRLAAWLRLARHEETWKTGEILILRHQLAVLQRQQPRRPELNRANRALLATLLSVLSKARRHGLRLLVTPDTVLRWHRDIVCRRWAARSKRGRTGRPATRRNSLRVRTPGARRVRRISWPNSPTCVTGASSRPRSSTVRRPRSSPERDRRPLALALKRPWCPAAVRQAREAAGAEPVDREHLARVRLAGQRVVVEVCPRGGDEQRVAAGAAECA